MHAVYAWHVAAQWCPWTTATRLVYPFEWLQEYVTIGQHNE